MELNSFKRLCIELVVLLLAIIVIRGIVFRPGEQLTAATIDKEKAYPEYNIIACSNILRNMMNLTIDEQKNIISKNADQITTVSQNDFSSDDEYASTETGEAKADGRNSDGKNVNGQNSDGRDVNGQNADTQSLDGQNVNGQNSDMQSQDGQNSDAQNVNGQNSDMQSQEGQGSDGKVLNGQDLDGQNADGHNADTQSPDGQNSDGQGLDGQNTVGQNKEGQAQEEHPLGYSVASFTEHEKEPSASLVEEKISRRADFYNYAMYSKLIKEAKELGGEDAIPTTCFVPIFNNDDRYCYITGAGMKAYKVGEMPTDFSSEDKALEKMVSFRVPVWKMDEKGKKYASNYSITVNRNIAESVKCIFTEIYELEMQFPFKYLVGFKYRKVGGSGLVNSKLMSIHSFGVAIDINNGDYDNDYYLGKGNDLRNRENPYCIPDEVIRIFERYGWNWGGNFDICADTMHFQYFGLEFLQYEYDEPFPVLNINAKGMKTEVIRNMTQRLAKLGYLPRETSKFTTVVEQAVIAFQKDMGIEADGIVDYETWVPLINKTHDMPYVF